MGKFKDEANDKLIIKFCSVRSKCYSYKVGGEIQEHKKLTGIKKSVCENEIKLEDYKECIFNHINKNIIQNTIINKKHKLYSISSDKLPLSKMMIIGSYV